MKGIPEDKELDTHEHPVPPDTPTSPTSPTSPLTPTPTSPTTPTSAVFPARDFSKGAPQSPQPGNYEEMDDAQQVVNYRKPKMSSSKSPQKLSPLKPGSKGVPCSVVLLDGETLEVPIDKNDTGRALFDRVCDHLDLVEKDYFGFTYTDDRGPSHLKYWLNLDKKINKVKKQGGAWVFDFALKFYPPDPAQLRESLTRWLVVLQIRRDLLSGRIPCTLTTYALLGAYNVQADIGEYDPNNHGHSLDYIRNMTFAPNQTPELLEKITELHKQHKGQTPDEAERQFLDNAKKLSMYGVDMHKAKDADNSAVMLGVCCSGVLIYREKLRISRFVWPKILKLSYKRNHFYVKIRPGELERGDTIMFKLDNHRLAKRLWKTCVEHHAFFRLRESEKPTNNPTFPRFGSKFRYSGRTLYESRNSQIDRPPPFFERSQPSRQNSYEDSANRSRSMDEQAPTEETVQTNGQTQDQIADESVGGRTKRLMSTDSRDSSLCGDSTLNRTREYNLDDGDTLQRRPYDSLDRRDHLANKAATLERMGRGDTSSVMDGEKTIDRERRRREKEEDRKRRKAAEEQRLKDATMEQEKDKSFMELNGDSPIYRNNYDDPCKYRFNKEGQQYPLAYPIDANGKEFAYDRDGNRFTLGSDGRSGISCPRNQGGNRYRFDRYGREFPLGFPYDVNGKEYPFDNAMNRFPDGPDGTSYRFDQDGNEYPHGYPHDSQGREFAYDKDGNTIPDGVGSKTYSFDSDGKVFRFDRDGNEYINAFPYDADGKEYPFDKNGSRCPFGKNGPGHCFDAQERPYPIAFPYDKEGNDYSYDKDGNRCPTEGFRFDKAGNEYPLAYPIDEDGKDYSYDAQGNRYPIGADGKDMPGYVYGRDGTDYRFDKDGHEFPNGYPCDEQGREYPYNKDGLRYPTSVANSYDIDGKKYRFDRAGSEYPHGYPYDTNGLEYPFDIDGNRCPYEGYRYDQDGNEYANGYPFGEDGTPFCFDRDGQRFPLAPDGRDRTDYVYDKDGKRYRFDKAGNEYPLSYPIDQGGVQFCYDRDGSMHPEAHMQNGHGGDAPDMYMPGPEGQDATEDAPYGVGLGVGRGDMTGVVGAEQNLDHTESYLPLPQFTKETKDSLKADTMPFFNPAATSTVGRSKGPPPPVPPKRQDNYKTQNEGSEEERVVQTVTITGDDDDDDFDFDSALADAIRSVTKLNPDMSVERIECVQQIDEVKEGN